MRKLSLTVANSLDNFIARSDGSTDWLRWSDDITAWMEQFWKRIDTVLVGRKTYDVAVRREIDVTQGLKTYLFSRTLTGSADDRVDLVAGDAAAFVGDLKNQPGQDLCLVGGGNLARSLFDARLIDEINLNVHPILLGRGVPLFPKMSHESDLALVECRPLVQGCVSVTYKVEA